MLLLSSIERFNTKHVLCCCTCMIAKSDQMQLVNSTIFIYSFFMSHFCLTRLIQVDPLLDSVKWDDKGLAVAIAQNVDTGAVLMQGFANKDALSKTISSRKATFYSRSRSALWTKGETSMNFINVYDIYIDCDRDSVRHRHIL